MRLTVLAVLGVAALSLAACDNYATAPASAGDTVVSATIDTAATVADAAQVAPPVTYADATTLDETLGRGVNLAYRGARLACELAVDLGRIKGERATYYRKLNVQVYAAVRAVDAAYAAGNSRSYREAVDKANPLIARLLSLAG